MKARLLKHISFVGKSMLWSVLLYMAFVLTFNWDDVATGFKQYRNNLPVASTAVSTHNIPATEAKHSVVVAVIKTVVAEFSKVAASMHD